LGYCTCFAAGFDVRRVKWWDEGRRQGQPARLAPYERGLLDGFWAFGSRFRPKIHCHSVGVRLSTLVCQKIHAHPAGATTAIDIR